MKFSLGFILIGVVALDFVSSVLWNVRPLVKVHLQPPRQQVSPANQHNNPYNRVHTFPQRHRMPHHNIPVYSYRPPSTSHGSVYLKNKQSVSHASNNKKHFRGPPYQHFRQDEMLMDKHKVIKFKTPSSNLVENFGYTPSSLDDSQHGYLSPKYKGWKPISKPHFHVSSPESKGDRHTYPTTEIYTDTNGKHHKLMLGTLFRDNVKSIKPPGHVKLKPEYSENRGVAIPLPPELGGSSVTLPSSIFLESPQHNNNEFYNPTVSTSQSEDKPVIRKPFPKFQPKPRGDDKVNQSSNNGHKDGVTHELPQLLSKFRNIRPKLRPSVQSQPAYDNEPEIDGIGPTNLPKIISPFPSKAPESSSYPPMSIKEKFNKVRTSIRTRRPRPDGKAHVNTEDLRQLFSQQRPDPGPLESSISAKEAYEDPQRQQQYNSQPYTLQPAYAKNISLFSQPSYAKESQPSTYADRTRDDYIGYKNRPSNPSASEQEASGNKIPGEPNVNVGESHSGLGYKPQRQRERKRKPNGQRKHVESVTPFVYNESPVYSDEFYLPSGFLQNPSLSRHNPVSFMTMPNSQPQVIHHTGHNGHTPQSPHQLYPINVIGSADHHKSKYNHGTSPNSNYVQNNRPHFLFMNIQNGHLQSTAPNVKQEAPIFTPQTYDTGVTSQPFSHSTHFPSGYVHDGTPKLPEQSQSLNYYHLIPTEGLPSTTLRNPYVYPSDSRFLFHNINQPTNYFDESSIAHHTQRTHQGIKRNRDASFNETYSHHPNINLDVDASNEYKQIPMEFLNHLRPILLDESQVPSNSAGYLQKSPLAQKENYSSEMYPPSEYFENFFKSYEVPYKQEEARNKYATQQSKNILVRIPYDSYKSSSNAQAEIVNPNSHNINKTLTNIPRWNPPKNPIISVSPVHEYTYESTVSPIQDIELYHSKPRTQKSWSILKYPHGSGFSSTELYISPSNKYKRLIGQDNSQQSGKEYSEIQTTHKPIFSSSFSSIRKGDDALVTEGSTHLKPIFSLMPKSNASSADDSNMLRIRVRGTTESSVDTKTESTERFESSKQQEGTRPLRRRKAGMPGHRFFSSTKVNEVGDEKFSDLPVVTSHLPRRLLLSTSTGATMAERLDDSLESFEATRAKRLKARRRFFNRRMNVHANRAGIIGLRATTPSASDMSDSVTYGESQWFRIKDNAEALESSKILSNEKSSLEKLSNPIVERITSTSNTFPTTPNTQLEPLEMSSESLIESESSSGRNFYEGSIFGGGIEQESQDEADMRVRTQTEPMS